MATKNLFFKSIPISYTITTSSNVPVADTSTLWQRHFTDRIESTESDVNTGTIVVYYNGQAIKNETGVGSPTDRFYYTVTTSLGTINSGTGADSGSTVDFYIHANTAYTGPGYASGTSASTLSNYDTFTITYYYSVYTA